MFTLSWRGYGLLGLMPPLLAALLASMFSSGGIDSTSFVKNFQITLALLSIAIWFVGKRLNGDAEYDDAQHTFMNLRLQNAGFIYITLLLLSLVFSK